MTTAPTQLSRSTVALLLAAILLISGLACAWAAWPEANPDREWDERHSMKTVTRILTTGVVWPAYALYPSLAYLPHTAVLATVRGVQRLAGAEPLTILESGIPTPTVYRICRLIGVLFALAAVLLTYVAGRRLFTPGVGLLAAFLMAAAPWFVRGATVFKPDPLLVLMTLATFLFSLEAAERGALKSYLLAGAAVGLTAGAKQNGALAAISVIAATLAAPLERRRWIGLALAGLVSAAVFVALNPFPELLVAYLQIGEKYDAWVATQSKVAPMPHLLVYLPQLFVSGAWHGPVVGAAALLGVALLPFEIVRRRRAGCSGAGLWVAFAFLVGFPLSVAAISSYPKANIVLPLLPFTSLSAAWVLATVWSLLARRLSGRPRRWALPLAVAALMALVLPESVRYVHHRAVPWTTVDLAAWRIQTTAPGIAHRSIVYEGNQPPEVRHDFGLRHGTAAWAVGAERLDELSEIGLNLSDYEIFPESRLRGAASEFYLGRLLVPGPSDEIWFARPRLGSVRGPAQVLVAHPWRAIEPGLEIEWRRGGKRSTALRSRLPEGVAAAEVASVDLVLTAEQAERCRLLLGERELPLYRYLWDEDAELRWMSRRFLVTALRAPLRLECSNPADLDPIPAADLWRWTRD